MTTGGIERIASDMDRLGAISIRPAGTEGERALLHVVREALPEGVDARIEGFVGNTSPPLSIAFHAALIVVGGAVGLLWPLAGLVVCLVATISLVGEGTGGFALLRGLLVRAASYNLSVPVIQPQNPRGSLVIAAPLDSPRGLAMRPPWLGRWPLQLFTLAGTVVTIVCLLRSVSDPLGHATLKLYLASLAVTLIGGVVALASHRAVPAEDATAPAALLEVIRRLLDEPVPGLEVWAVFTGCGRAYQSGIDAFLRVHAQEPPGPLLVVSLLDPGRAPLRAAISEGILTRQVHKATGPALVERLRWAGVDLPEIDRPGASDARAAHNAGHAALLLVGGSRSGAVEGTADAAEAVCTIAHWYARDVGALAERQGRLAPVVLADANPEAG